MIFLSPWVLMACPRGGDPVEVVDSGLFSGFCTSGVAPVLLELEPEAALNGLALSLRGEDVGGTLSAIGLELTLTNQSTESDCVVAAYASPTAPDALALFAVDPAVYPPDQVEGLGTLVFADNLTRIWNESVTDVAMSWEVEVPIQEEAEVPVEWFVSFVTCAAPSLSLEGALQATWIDKFPGLDAYGTWTAGQLW